MKRTVELTTLPPAKAWLVVHGGPQDGLMYTLRQSTTTVGKDATLCDFVLSDSAISREHARLKQESGQYVLFDLASSNGTTVNKEPVTQLYLRDNDVIRLGNTILVFKHIPAQLS